MGAETEAHVWCDGPPGGGGTCPLGDNHEYGPTIKAVREFLKGLGWVTRRRDGGVVDLCLLCRGSK